MTKYERETIRYRLRGLISEYGPWAILWEVTKLLKPEFKALEAKEKKKRVRPSRAGEGREES